jgi:hypothetical protein
MEFCCPGSDKIQSSATFCYCGTKPVNTPTPTLDPRAAYYSYPGTPVNQTGYSYPYEHFKYNFLSF